MQLTTVVFAEEFITILVCIFPAELELILSIALDEGDLEGMDRLRKISSTVLLFFALNMEKNMIKYYLFFYSLIYNLIMSHQYFYNCVYCFLSRHEKYRNS